MKRKAEKIRPSVEKLSDEVFAKVQQAQGFFFISDDGGGGMDAAKFFERIRGRLAWGRKAVKEMDAFLRKYGQTDASRRRAK